MKRTLVILLSLAVGAVIAYFGGAAIMRFIRNMGEEFEWTDGLRSTFLNFAWVALYGLIIAWLSISFFGTRKKPGVACALIVLHVFALTMQMQMLIGVASLFAEVEIWHNAIASFGMMAAGLIAIMYLITHLIAEPKERVAKEKKEKKVKEKKVKEKTVVADVISQAQIDEEFEQMTQEHVPPQPQPEPQPVPVMPVPDPDPIPPPPPAPQGPLQPVQW